MAPAIPKTSTTKFRMPTSENLVPISIDLEIDGQHFKDAFIWNNKADPDSEVVVFARRTARDLKLPSVFIIPIAQSIQSQLTEFRSFEGLDMTKGERIVPLKLDLRVNRTVIRDQFLWDVNNFDNNPEEFARTLCKDMGIEDPEVGPAVAVAIRQQLYEIAVQSVSSREMRVTKKGRRDRGVELIPSSKLPGTFDLVKMFGQKSTILRKRKEWDLYEPFIDILSAEEAEALDAREERIARLKKRVDDKL